MPANGDNTHYTVTYPTNDQHARWQETAEEMGCSSLSQFIKEMVEAGIKKFDAAAEPDATRRELREQRRDLKDELDHARQRIGRLEDRLLDTEYMAIREYVAENPGATYEDIKSHVQATAPQRVTRHLDDLDGGALRVENQHYFPAPEDDGPDTDPNRPDTTRGRGR